MDLAASGEIIWSHRVSTGDLRTPGVSDPYRWINATLVRSMRGAGPRSYTTQIAAAMPEMASEAYRNSSAARFRRSSTTRRQDKCLHNRALLVLFQLRLVMQHSVQQRTVDLDVPVISDEAKLTELVHEVADARSGGADHVRQCLLADIRSDRLWCTFLAKMRQQQEHAGDPPLARIEKLVDQVFFNPAVPGQKIGHEQLGKRRLIVKHGLHGLFCNLRDDAVLQCGRGARPPRHT